MEGAEDMSKYSLEAWAESGICPLLRMPAAVVAPVLGIACYSTYRPAPALLHLEGVRGAGKTLLGEIACQFAPAGRALGLRGPVAGAPEAGSTWMGLTRAMEQAPLGLLLVDEVVAPSGQRSSVARLNDLVRVTQAPDRSSPSEVRARRVSVVTTSIYAPSEEFDQQVHRVTVTGSGVASALAAEARRRDGSIARARLAGALTEWVSRHQDLRELERRSSERRGWKFGEALAPVRSSKLAAAFGLELLVMMLREGGSQTAVDVEAWGSGVSGVVQSSGRPVAEECRLPSVRLDVEAVLAPLVQGNAGAGLVDRCGQAVVPIGEVRDGRVLVLPAGLRRLLMSRFGSRYEGASSKALGASLEAAGLLVRGGAGRLSQVQRIDGVPQRVWVLAGLNLDHEIQPNRATSGIVMKKGVI